MRHADRLPHRQPTLRVIDQDPDREVSGLRVGDPTDEVDLARRAPGRLRPPSRPSIAARESAVLTRAVCPTRTAEADRDGSQTEAKTCRVSTTSPIGVPMAIVWPGWQVRLSSTPSIGERIV